MPRRRLSVSWVRGKVSQTQTSGQTAQTSNSFSQNRKFLSLQEAEHSLPVSGLPHHGVLSHLGREAHQTPGDQHGLLVHGHQQVSLGSQGCLGGTFSRDKVWGNCPLMFFNWFLIMRPILSVKTLQHFETSKFPVIF